jgi:hypothetical protein
MKVFPDPFSKNAARGKNGSFSRDGGKIKMFLPAVINRHESAGA